MTRRDLSVAACLLGGVLLLSHVCLYKVLTNIRSDQLMIRHWIARELRNKHETQRHTS